MLFKVEITLRLPPNLSKGEMSDIRQREKHCTQEMQRSGKLRHLWQRAGKYAAIGIYDVSDNEELHAAIAALPLFPYLDIHVEPLCRHPSSIHGDDR